MTKDTQTSNIDLLYHPFWIYSLSCQRSPAGYNQIVTKYHVTYSSRRSTMQPGQLLCDRYRVEKALAAGGFGETYLAVDTHLPSQPQVVVKLLKPLNSDPATMQIAQRLFNMEAATLEQLGKDNDRIPSLYAYFELRGEFYLVQEYIDGTTLTAEVWDRQSSESDTLAILKEILTGLERVHNQKIVHRDLKPDNIIRREIDRKLVLIDFGAVKQVRAATVATPNPAVSRTIGIGTQGYMPTEQSMGFPKLASDIYAVGAIGIQCLTGSAPHLLFNEDSLSIEWQHLRRVDPDLAIVLTKMVEPDYRQRYTNATEALNAIASLMPSPTPPQTQTLPTPPPFQPLPTPPPVQSLPTPAPLVVTPSTQPLPQARSSPAKATPSTQAVPEARSAPAKPLQTPVQRQVKPLLTRIDRRKFLKWLRFGGLGALSVSFLGFVAWLWDYIHVNSPPADPPSLPTADVLTQAGTSPQLTEIQFTSVKLDRKGEIVDKPSGSAQIFTEDLGNGVKLTMVKIPAGKFLMGSPAGEEGSKSNESPQHQVDVPAFYLGQTVVTQAQWVAIMGNNPSSFKGNDKLPVERVSWLDAVNLCQKLSQKTGRIYRLPSEAEWEYACRAGTTTPFSFGETITPAVVNYDGNYPYAGASEGEYRRITTPVGTFSPNLFGLYDMHGNVWEWCLDEWVDNYNGALTDGSARKNIISQDKNKRSLLRGGAWYGNSSSCRSAYRFNLNRDDAYDGVGFRIVCPGGRTA